MNDDGENIPNSNYGRNLDNLGSIEVKAQGPKVDPDDGRIEENQNNCVEILESNLSTWTVKNGTMEEEEGAANQAFQRVCTNYCRVSNSNIFVVLETIIGLGKLKGKFKQLGFDGFCCAGGRGFSGGIALSWKIEKLSISIIQIHF
ncbi:unnamed protein product [Vicia faba]|nr:unnamed protein product [Vicia faba]